MKTIKVFAIIIAAIAVNIIVGPCTMEPVWDLFRIAADVIPGNVAIFGGLALIGWAAIKVCKVIANKL